MSTRMRRSLFTGVLALAVTAMLSGCTLATVIADSRRGDDVDTTTTAEPDEGEQASLDADSSLALACLDNSMFSGQLTGGRPVEAWLEMTVEDGVFVLTGHDAADLIVDGGEMQFTLWRTAGNDDGNGDSEVTLAKVGYREVSSTEEFAITYATYDAGKDMGPDVALDVTDDGFTLTLPLMEAFVDIDAGPGPFMVDLTSFEVGVFSTAQNRPKPLYSERTHVCNTGTIGPVAVSPAFVEDGELACYDRTWGDGGGGMPLDASYVSFALIDHELMITEAAARPGGGEITVFADGLFEIEPGQTISIPWMSDGVVLDPSLEVNTPSVWCMSRAHVTPAAWIA